ncbi:MAG: nuclease-related domain-containing protein [Anaerolineales bacterium]|nr:nuclease-related domain-containing protein [Anaerolineales bacterium]
MKSIIDRKMVQRRAAISNAASVGGMLILLVSVVLPMFNADLVTASNVLMGAGLATAMLGIYYANRWVKKPRPEDILDKELKGLRNNHRLYHYSRLPCDHVLLAPNAVVIIETVNLAGEFSYSGGRWRERISLGRALRYIVEEHLGDPIKAARSAQGVLQQRLGAAIPGGEAIPVHPLVVFTHPAAQIEVSGSPLPVCLAGRLVKHLPAHLERLALETYEAVRSYLDSQATALAGQQ